MNLVFRESLAPSGHYILGDGRHFSSDGERVRSPGAAYKENGTRLLYEGMK